MFVRSNLFASIQDLFSDQVRHSNPQTNFQFMEQVTPETVLQAIAGVLSSTVTRDQRVAYQQLLIAQKESSHYAGVLCRCLEICADESIRVFILTALQEWVKRWWSSMAQDQQLELRGTLSAIVSSVPDGADGSYCSKCGALVTDLAERQYPQIWPTFVEDMIQLWLQGSYAKQETTLKAFHYLYTDCTDPEFSSQLSTTRRQEILTAMQPHQPQLMGLTFQFVSNHLSSLSNQDPRESALHKRSITLALQLMNEMATLINVDEWLRVPNTNFLAAFATFILHPDFALSCGELLHKLLRRTVKADDSEVLLAVIGFLATKRDVYSVYDDDESRVKLVHLYSTTLSGSLNSNWAAIVPIIVKDAAVRGAVHDVLGTTMQLVSAGTSYRAGCDALLDMYKLYRTDGLETCATLKDLTLDILNVFFQRGVKPLFIDQPRLEAEPAWFNCEFESDKEEWQQSYGTYSSQLGLLFGEVTALYPELAVQFLVVTTQQLIDVAASAVASGDARLVLMADRVAHLLHRVSGIVIDICVARFEQKSTDAIMSAPGRKERNTPVSSFAAAIQLLYKLASLLFTWQPPSNSLIREKLRLFAVFSSLFSLPSAQGSLIQVLGSLFQSLKSTPVAGSGANDGIAERAADSITAILHKCAGSIGDPQVLEQILQAAGEVLAVTSSTQGAYSPAVQMSMRETMLVLSAYAPRGSPLQSQLVTLACQDIVVSMQHYASGVFPSLDSVSQHLASLDATGGKDVQWLREQLEGLRDTVVNFLTVTRKADTSELDNEVFAPLFGAYCNGLSFSNDQQSNCNLNEANVLALYPMAQFWMTFLQCLRQLTPVIIQLTMCPVSLSPTIQRLCRVTAKSEVYRLLGRKYTVGDLRGYELSEAMRNLVSNMFKALDMASRHRVLYLMDESFMRDELAGQYMPALQIQHLVRALNYTLVGYTSNLVPHITVASHGVYLAQMLRVLQSRHQSLWVQLKESSGQWDDALEPGYADLTVEDIAAARENRVREFSAQFAELLASLVSVRGILSPAPVPAGSLPGPSAERKTRSTMTTEDKKTARRYHIVSLLLLNPVNEALSHVYLESLLLCLQTPDLVTVRTALNVATWLLTQITIAHHPTSLQFPSWQQEYQSFLRWEVFLCSQVLSAVLNVLLQQERWSMDLGWDLTDFVLELVRVYVLLVPLDGSTGTGAKGSATTADASGIANSAMEKSQAYDHRRSLSGLVLQQFLQTGLTSAKELEELAAMLAKYHAKKKQRDLLKDFVSERMISKVHNRESLAQQGSSIVGAKPKIVGENDSIPRSRSKKKPTNAILSSELVNDVLGKLFDDDFDDI